MATSCLPPSVESRRANYNMTRLPLAHSDMNTSLTKMITKEIEDADVVKKASTQLTSLEGVKNALPLS